MALAAGVGIPTAASAASSPAAALHDRAKPTVVLVHGAFADPSSFAAVTKRLQKDGYKVLSAPNPLRNLSTDAAGVAAFINQNTTGPVVLVGHSYGGMVISNAALDTPRVKALVYVDAYAPAKGESALGLNAAKPGSVLNVKDPSTVLDFVSNPGAADGVKDAYIKPKLFDGFFAAKLPKAQADVLAAGQSPATTLALNSPSGEPAWKSIKSYFFVGTDDKIIPVAEQLAMANRAHGTIVEGKADHLSMPEVPGTITTLIEKAATN